MRLPTGEIRRGLNYIRKKDKLLRGENLCGKELVITSQGARVKEGS